MRGRWGKIKRGYGLLALVLALNGLMGAGLGWASSFTVSPTRFEFSLSKRFTNFFTVTNTSDAPLRVKIYPLLVEMGANQVKEVKEVKGSPHDLSGQVVINPRHINLMPGERRVVRFSVRQPQNPADGEYRTFIFFEELPQVQRLDVRPPEGAVGLRLELLTRVGVPLYGQVGKPQGQAAYLHKGLRIEKKRLVLEGVLANQGSAHIQFKVKGLLSNPGGETAVMEEMMVLQRESERKWEFSVDKPPKGEYRYQVTGEREKETLFQFSQTIQVP